MMCCFETVLSDVGTRTREQVVALRHGTDLEETKTSVGLVGA